MNLAKILLPVHDGLDIGPMTKTAFVLADRFNAHVEALYPRTPVREQLILPGEAAAPSQLKSLVDEAERRAIETEQQIAGRFNEIAASFEGISSSFVPREGGISNIVARHGRVADLTVIGTVAEREPGAWSDIRESAIFQTGRPVVVAPASDVPVNTGDTLVIAWKDGVEAARAVAAARRFMDSAKSVRIVTVSDNPKAEASLDAVAEYVGHYAKAVESAVLSRTKPSAAELLLDEAGRHEGALLVLGAYSQWRWKEWAFGGVTEFILNHATVPVLMAR